MASNNTDWVPQVNESDIGSFQNGVFIPVGEPTQPIPRAENESFTQTDFNIWYANATLPLPEDEEFINELRLIGKDWEQIKDALIDFWFQQQIIEDMCIEYQHTHP